MVRSLLQKTKSQAKKKELQREVTRIERQIQSEKEQRRKQEAEVAAKVGSCPLSSTCCSDVFGLPYILDPRSYAPNGLP